jgi:hypothetical protein
MDIRNVYESSQVDQVDAERVEQFASAMRPEDIKKFLLYKRFLRTLISDIRTELRSQVEQNFLSRLRERVRGTAAEVFKGLDGIITRIDEPEYQNIEGFIAINKKSGTSEKISNKVSLGVEASILPSKLGASLKAGIEAGGEQSESIEKNYAQLLMRVVGINDVISELKAILGAIGIKYFYIFLDDFSELPEEPMQLLVDSLISPLPVGLTL